MTRKIENAMIAAIRAGKNFKSGNTEVVQIKDHTCYFDHAEVRLHGNVIARIGDSSAKWTLAGWNTTTTRSRINALARAFNWRGVSVKAGVAFAAGSAVAPYKVIAATEWVDALA